MGEGVTYLLLLTLLFHGGAALGAQQERGWLSCVEISTLSLGFSYAEDLEAQKLKRTRRFELYVAQNILAYNYVGTCTTLYSSTCNTQLKWDNENILDNFRINLFFFWQLLFPICDPEKSGIENDPRLPFYSKVEGWTQQYALDLDMFGSYGHDFKPIMSKELLHFDMVVVRDGLLGGMSGAIHRRWKKDDAAYDPEIAGAITHTRWIQSKRVYKLNNNHTVPKKGEPNYDPAYKYDYIYRCLTFNINAVTETADLDLCGDETTCGHGGYGEADSGILARRMNKPGVTFGMQTVLVSDVHRNRPRAYTHRHKVWEKEVGWTKEGPREVKRLIEMLEPMVIGQPNRAKVRQIFPSKPHCTWDNYFSGDEIMDYLGEKGFAATMTCQRNRLPKGIGSEFLHKEKTVPGCPVARVARFKNPTTLVTKRTKSGQMPVIPNANQDQNVEPTDITWTRVHVTFQSTSSTNISTVNALNENRLFVRKKERGRGKAGGKKAWAIEMNEARQLYLASYGRIDTIDSLIKHCKLYYRSWKYWHSCKLHVQALGLVVAYDMYKEIVEEGFAEFGFVSKEEATKKCFIVFHTFRDRLSYQGLRYQPEDKKYPGDEFMRASTVKKRRKGESQEGAKRGAGRPRKEVTPEVATRPTVTNEQFHREKEEGRLCGDLTKYFAHKQSIVTVKHPAICRYCGKDAYSKCGICVDMWCHDRPRTGPCKGYDCFTKLHNDQQFGLARVDCELLKSQKREWCMPTTELVDENSQLIQKIKQSLSTTTVAERVPTVEDSL